MRLSIGGAQQLLYLPATLAAQLGHYEEVGLSVDLENFPGGAKALEAMLGGSADVVCGFYDHVIQMKAEARELIGITLITQYPGIVLAVAPGKTLSFADLKGKRIGVTTPGSSTHLLTSYLLSRKGIASDSVSIVGIGAAATAVAAMEHGQVDAAALTEPALTELLARHKLQILADTRTKQGVEQDLGVPSYPSASLYTSAAWLKQNAEAAERLVRAMRKTLAWIASHTAAEIAAKMPAEHKGTSEERYIASLEASKAMYSPTGDWTVEGAEAVRQVLSQSMEKVAKAKVNAAETFTNELGK